MEGEGWSRGGEEDCGGGPSGLCAGPVMFAIERLAKGFGVQTVVFDLEYESAFITMFKRVMG